MLYFDTTNIQNIIADAIKEEPTHSKSGSEMISQVWKFQYKNKDYALKITQAKSNDAETRISQEHKFIKDFQHRNSVQYAWHGHFQTPRSNRPAYALITEWLPGSTLHSMLQDTVPLFSSNQELKSCLHNFELLIHKLHHQGIFHRDLWSKNIILYKSTLFLFDFGWACYAKEKNPYTPRQMRNPNDQTALKVLFDEIEHHFKETSAIHGLMEKE